MASRDTSNCQLRGGQECAYICADICAVQKGNGTISNHLPATQNQPYINPYASTLSDISKTMAGNTAAWLTAKLGAFKVGPSVRGIPKSSEILVRTHALAVNPADSWERYVGGLAKEFPAILGYDTAGEVVEVGAGVNHFKVGDRVLGISLGAFGVPERAGFQKYVILDSFATAKIPDSLSYAAASVIPLGAGVAAVGVFGKDYLNLSKADAPGKAVVVWGASSSIGGNVVQFASKLGYRVFAVASAKNHNAVLSLGAERAFDYHDDSVIDQLAGALKGVTVAGAYSAVISDDAPMKTAQVLARTSGNKFVASAGNVSGTLPDGVTAKWVVLKYPHYNEEVIRTLKIAFGIVETGLANGEFRAFPPPQVVGSGLEAVEEAVAVRNKGVSAAKVVVELP